MLGYKLDDKELAIILMFSLPESWNNFIAGAETSDPDKFIFRTIQEDRRLCANESDTTLLARGKKKKANPNVTCWTCGKKGHYASDHDKKDSRKNSDKDKGKDDQKRKDYKAHPAVSDTEDYVLTAN